ncbi:MAG: oligoendopeptidase F [Candidatus Paceibacterota bacterium]|jgi:oligoendopeptidase F
MERKQQKIIFGVVAILFVAGTAAGLVVFNANLNGNKPAPEPEVQTIGETKTGVTLQRSEIEPKYQWNLGEIYSSRADFDKDVELARAQIKEFPKLKGTLSSDESIKIAFKTFYSLDENISRISGYASMYFDQDTRGTEGAEMKKISDRLSNEFGDASSFFNPELLGLSKERLESLAANADLKDYRMHIVDLLRYKDHILSDKEESLLAQSSIMRNSGYNVFDIFTNSELQFPEVTFSDGKKVKLTQALFEGYRQSPNREDRKTIFNNFFGTLISYKNTFAQTLSSQVDANIFYSKARKFDSAAQDSLFSENIPAAVYEKIIQEVNDNLPVLQQYVELKKNILGIDDMNYYDLYALATNGIKDSYTYEQSNDMILEALKPMGDEYLKVVSEAIKPGSGWIDVYPSQGKTNGAYAGSAAYDVHPYILMNFSGNYYSVSTEIHELGHAVNSYFSNINQPYSQSDYTTFTAEIASTFNENLLFESRLNQETDKAKKIALLGESLETMRTTIFRQALFSEFEYKIYQAAENNTPLTADFLNQTYLNLVKKYYGSDKGVISVDDQVGIEWAYVPHFYYDFYVYKYVSGYLAGMALSEKVLSGDTATRDAYIEKVLKDGGSRYPLEQLEDVGIDMSSDQVYKEAFAIFQKRIDQLKELTGK